MPRRRMGKSPSASLNKRNTPPPRWCRGNASAVGARGPGFNPSLRQGFYVCYCCCVFTFFVQKHIICHKIFAMLIYVVYTSHHARFVTEYKNIKICYLFKVITELVQKKIVHAFSPAMFSAG